VRETKRGMTTCIHKRAHPSVRYCRNMSTGGRTRAHYDATIQQHIHASIDEHMCKNETDMHTSKGSCSHDGLVINAPSTPPRSHSILSTHLPVPPSPFIPSKRMQRSSESGTATPMHDTLTRQQEQSSSMSSSVMMTVASTPRSRSPSDVRIMVTVTVTIRLITPRELP